MSKKVLVKDRGLVIDFPDEWTDDQIETSIASKIDPVFHENNQIVEGKWKDTVDALHMSIRKTAHSSKEYFQHGMLVPYFATPDFEPSRKHPGMLTEKRPGLGLVEGMAKTFGYGGEDIDMFAPEKMARRLFDRIVDPDNTYYTQAEVNKIKARSDAALQFLDTKHQESMGRFNDWVEAHPEMAPRDAFAGNVIDRVKEDPSILADPAFWAYKAAETLPFTLMVMGTTVAATAATGSPIAGLAAGTGVAIPMITEDLFNQLKENGATDYQAASISEIMGPVIASVESIGDFGVLISINAGFKKAFRGEMTRQVVRSTTQMIKQGVVQYGKGALLAQGGEILEELTQDAMTNAAVKVVNRSQGIFDNWLDTMANTFVSTAGFGVLGGGARARDAWHEMATFNDRKPMGKTQFKLSVMFRRDMLHKKQTDGTITEQELKELKAIEASGGDEGILSAIYGVRVEEKKQPSVVRDLESTPYKFRSKLEDEVEMMEQNKFTPEQLINYLKGRGVSDLEIDAIIGGHLDEKEGKVKTLTKEELLEVIRASQFVVEDIQYGDEPGYARDNSESEQYQEDANGYEYERDQAEGKRDEASEREGAADYRWTTLQEELEQLAPEDFADATEYHAKIEELQNDRDQAEEERDEAQSEWQEYQDEYTEAENRREEAQDNADETYISEDDYEEGEQEDRHYGYSTKEGWNYREFLLKLDPDSRILNSGEFYPDTGHWGGERTGNTFVHVRVTTVMNKDGKEVFLIQEIQSDWDIAIQESGESAQYFHVEWVEDEKKIPKIETIEDFAKWAKKKKWMPLGGTSKRMTAEEWSNWAEGEFHSWLRRHLDTGEDVEIYDKKYKTKENLEIFRRYMIDTKMDPDLAKGEGVTTRQFRSKVMAEKFLKSRKGGNTSLRKGTMKGRQPYLPVKGIFNEIAMKYMIMKAIDEGVGQVTWVSGHDTRGIYNDSMRQKVHHISYRKLGPDLYAAVPKDSSGSALNFRQPNDPVRKINFERMTYKEMKKALGGYIADMIVNDTGVKGTRMLGALEGYSDFRIEKVEYPGFTRAEFNKENTRRRRGRIEPSEYKLTDDQYQEGVDYYDSYYRHALYGKDKDGKEEIVRRTRWKKDLQAQIKENTDNDARIEGDDIRIGGEWATRTYGDTMENIKSDYPSNPDMEQFAYEGKDASRTSVFVRKYIRKFGGKLEMIDVQKTEGKPSVTGTNLMFDGLNYRRIGGNREDWHIESGPITAGTGEPGFNIHRVFYKDPSYDGEASEQVSFSEKEDGDAAITKAQRFIDKQVRAGVDDKSLYSVRESERLDGTKIHYVMYGAETIEAFDTLKEANDFVYDEERRERIDTDWRQRRGFEIPEKLEKVVKEFGVYVAEERKWQEYLSESPSEDDVAFGGNARKQRAYRRFVKKYGGQGEINAEIRRQLLAKGYADIRGTTVKTVRDLGEAGSIYRDPTVEQFQVIYVDEQTGEVLYNSVETIGNPTMYFDPQLTEKISITLSRLSAEGKQARFYVIHNHPSGNPTASAEDKQMTKDMSGIFGEFFKGHAVLDHDEFSFIKPEGNDFKLAYKGGPKQNYGQGKIATEIANRGLIPADKEHYTILFMDANGRILGVSKTKIGSPDMWEHIRQGQKANGASGYALFSEAALPSQEWVAQNMTAGLVNILRLDADGNLIGDWSLASGLYDDERHKAFKNFQMNLPDSRQAFNTQGDALMRVADSPNIQGGDQNADNADSIIEEVDKVNSENETEVKKSGFIRMREATLAKIKAKKLAEGLRKGGPKTRDEVSFVQGEIKKLLVGLDLEGKGEMIATITGILTQEQLTKRLDDIYARLESIADKDKIDAYTKAIDRLSKVKNMAPDYKEQVDDILEDYDLKRRSKKTKAKREKRSEFLERMRESGDLQGIPDTLFVDLGKKTLDEMTAEEVRELHDVLAMLVKLGQMKSKLISRKEKRDLEEEVANLVGRMYEKTGISEDMSEKDIMDILKEVREKRERTGPRKVLDLLKGIWFQHIKIEHNTISLGIHDLFLRVHEGLNKKKRLGTVIYGKLEDAFKKLGDYSKKVNETVEFTQTDTEGKTKTFELTREQIIGVALNNGNDGNRQRLNEGYKYTDENIEEIVSKLSPEEKQFVEDVWNLFDEMFPEMDKTTREMLGIRVQKVKGRYFPIVVDSDIIKLAEMREKEMDLFQEVFQMAYINQGFRKTRKGGTEVVNLNVFGLITQHIDNVLQYSSMAMPIRDAQKIITHPRFRKAMVAVYGEKMYNQYREWLMDTANPKRMRTRDDAGRIMTMMRHNATAVILGWKVVVSAVQALSITQTVHVLNKKWGGQKGVRYVRQAAAEYVMNRDSVKGFVYQVSEEMAQRKDAFDRDLKEWIQNRKTKKRVQGKDVDAKEWDETLFSMIQMVDEQTVMTTWMASFNSIYDITKDNMDEAVQFADSVVRTTQPAGEAINLPGIMRGTAWQKNFTMFMSHFINFHNLMVMEMDRLRFSKDHPMRKLKNFSEAYFYLVAAPSIAATFIRSGGEEDDWKTYMRDMFLYQFSGMFIARDLMTAMVRGFDFGKSPAFSAGEYATYAIRSKDWQKKIVNGAKASTLVGIKIPHQVINSIDGLVDLLQGETKDLRRLVMTEYQLHGKKGGKKRKPYRP